VVTDVIDPDLWKLPKWEDIPAEDLDMTNLYDDMLALVKKCVIFPEFIHYKIFVLWIISSWKVESWSSVGFLTFKGLDGSGKTRALDLIREMGYRMVQTLGTVSALSRLTHSHNAGLLIDEAGDRLDRKTESGRDMLEFIKTSYRKGSTYATADKNDQDETRHYRTFSFKALAGEENFDEALLSLSIDITMAKDYPAVNGLRYVQDKLDDIHTKLLNYRYKTPPPPDLGERFILRGRTREVYGNIISTAKHVGVITEDILEYVERREKEREEDLQTLEWEILTAISDIMGEPQYSLDGKIMEGPREYISYNDIREEMYGDIDDPFHYDIDDEKETQQGLEQEIGDTLENSLFVKAKKTKMGMVVPINDPKTRRRLIYLFKTYNIKIEAK